MADDLGAYRQWDDGRDRIWAALVEALVVARLVVVDQELIEHRLQVASGEDQHVVKQLPAGCADEPSQIEFARGARYGSCTTFTSSEWKT